MRPEPDETASSTLRRAFAERRPVAFVVTSSEGLSHLSPMIERSLAPVADASTGARVAVARRRSSRRIDASPTARATPASRAIRLCATGDARHRRHARMTRVSSIPSPPHSAVLAPVAATPFDAVPAAMRDEVRRLRRTMLLWMVFAFVVLLALAVGLWFIAANRLDRSEREFARRIQDDGVASRSAQTLAQQVQDQSMANTAKIGALEARVADSQSQQASLEQLYTDLARTRDDWALAEVEQILAVASEQLQLAGNVQGAIIALQNADQRLARTERPQFIVLRRAIAKDLERLKALPSVDIAGNALRIDTHRRHGRRAAVAVERAARAVERRRRAATARPRRRSTRRAAGSSGCEAPAAPARRRRMGALRATRPRPRRPRAGRAAADAEPGVLRPRERQAAAAERAPRAARRVRRRPIAPTSRTRARRCRSTSIRRSRQTQAALALLRQVESANTVVEMPTLADSLAAARNVKGQR